MDKATMMADTAAIEPEHRADESCWCGPRVERGENGDGDVVVHRSLRSILSGVSDAWVDANKKWLN